MKQYRIYHSKKGIVVEDMLFDRKKIFKDKNGSIALFKAKRWVKKHTLIGIRLTKKMKRAGYDDSEIVKETGYYI